MLTDTEVPEGFFHVEVVNRVLFFFEGDVAHDNTGIIVFYGKLGRASKKDIFYERSVFFKELVFSHPFREVGMPVVAS